MGDRGSESGTITHDMSDVDECPTNVVSRGSLLFYLTVFGLLLGASSMGSVYGYSSPAVPSLESNSSRIHFDRKRDIDIETLVRSLPFMGSLIGSLSGGPLAGLKGRKICSIITSIGLLTSWIVVGTSINIPMLLVGRFFNGLFAGITSATVPNYLSEISPVRLRGTIGSLVQTSGSAGVLLVSLLGLITDWSGLAYCLALPSLVMPIILIFSVESPVYLFNKYGYGPESLTAIKKLRTFDSEFENELRVIARCPQSSESILLKWAEFKMPIVYLPMIYTWIMLILNQATGIFAVISYEKEIFEMAKVPLSADVCTIILNSIGLLMTIVSSYISDKFNRKTLLFVSGVGSAIGLSGYAACFYMNTKYSWFAQQYGWLTIVAGVAYFLAFSIGWGCIPWYIGAEMSPFFARGFILSAGCFLNGLSAVIITQTFEYMTLYLSAAGTFSIYALISVAAVCFSSYFLPETRGKTNDQILEIFNQRALERGSLLRE